MLNCSPFVLKGLVDPQLIEILYDFAYTFGSPTVTSLHRPGDKGVHGTVPCRGADVRCRDAKVGEQMAAWVNEQWVYDPEREDKMCAMAHNVGMGMHLHLQVHPNTKRRK